MNKNIIKHFLRDHKHLILNKSLKNVHCWGVDSVLLDDTPGERIRIFFARKDHELWKNIFKSMRDISIAYHSHHCDLTLECIYGSLIDEHIQKITEDNKSRYIDHSMRWKLDEFLYKSPITKNEEGIFEKVGKAHIWYGGCNVLEPEADSEHGIDRIVNLKASDIHSVFVKKGQEAAWVVYEGKEDPDYSPICYSNADLTKFDKSGMYQKMDENYLDNLLKEFRLI